jgi:hypothetical protein
MDPLGTPVEPMAKEELASKVLSSSTGTGELAFMVLSSYEGTGELASKVPSSSMGIEELTFMVLSSSTGTEELVSKVLSPSTRTGESCLLRGTPFRSASRATYSSTLKMEAIRTSERTTRCYIPEDKLRYRYRQRIILIWNLKE